MLASLLAPFALVAALLAGGAVDLAETTAWARTKDGPQYGQNVKVGDDSLTVEDEAVVFDTAKIGDWNMAVLMLPAELTKDLEPGKAYVFSVEAKGESGASTIITVPQVDEAKSTDDEVQATGVWKSTPGVWSRLRVEFVFDPDVNDGRIQFYFNEEQQGPTYRYRDLSVTPVN